MERRVVLKRMVEGSALLVAGVIGVPATLAVLSPAIDRPQDARWVPIDLLARFPVGQMRTGLLRTGDEGAAIGSPPQSVFVWRPTESEIVVFSRSCTDLGCPLTWDAGSECFLCPCHGGIFSKSGQPMAGPPSRPMYRYDTRVRNRQLEADVRSVPPMV